MPELKEDFDTRGRLLQAASQGGDLGDTLAVILICMLLFTGVCAFLGWYSRRRG